MPTQELHADKPVVRLISALPNQVPNRKIISMGRTNGAPAAIE
jgi:hypothetical protein